MNRLEEAMARLDRAVARLEATRDGGAGGAEHRRLREVVGQIAARVDDALARIELALREES
jgi:hypothetical protein